VTGRKNKSSKGIGEIEGCTNDQQKATAFNKFYCNIAHNLNDKLPPPRGDFKKYLPIISEDLQPLEKFRQITFEDVEWVLSDLMVSKTSFSHDNISNKQLKLIAKEISFPLSHLINMSFKHDFVPSSWKLVKVIPLFKSCDCKLTTNYRPISLLPTLSEVLEKIAYRQCYNHLVGRQQSYLQTSVRFPQQTFHTEPTHKTTKCTV
jgi:hypothetical protein